MSKKYIGQVNNQNFVFPNNQVSEYDVNIIHDINDNCVSGSVINFTTSSVTTTSMNVNFDYIWDLNGAIPYVRNSSAVSVLSLHMMGPSQNYYKPFLCVDRFVFSGIPITRIESGVTPGFNRLTFVVTPSMLGLNIFETGTYYFEIKFISERCIFPVCFSQTITIVGPTPTPTPTPGPTPTPTPTATPTATATPTPTTCSLTLFFDVTASPAPGGWDSSALACAGTGTPLTVYVSNAGGCPATFDDVFTDGKAIYTNSSLTTLLNGNDKFFKSVSSPSSGKSIQIGTDGFIDSISTC